MMLSHSASIRIQVSAFLCMDVVALATHFFGMQLFCACDSRNLSSSLWPHLELLPYCYLEDVLRIPGLKSLVIDESSICSIKRGTFLADLIVHSSLIIWDEAPMTHKHCFESLDRSMRDILGEANSSCLSRLFGGKTVVLGGDFRQVLPVVEGGSRLELDTIDASITNSYLWKHVRILS
jgi:hypothetical protein